MYHPSSISNSAAVLCPNPQSSPLYHFILPCWTSIPRNDRLKMRPMPFVVASIMMMLFASLKLPKISAKPIEKTTGPSVAPTLKIGHTAEFPRIPRLPAPKDPPKYKMPKYRGAKNGSRALMRLGDGNPYQRYRYKQISVSQRTFPNRGSLIFSTTCSQTC